jgi:hypothetical protein
MTRLARALVQSWNRFWFEPASATDLGVCRVMFFAGLFLFYLPVDFSEWGHVSTAFWMPLPMFSLLHLGPASAAALDSLSTVWRIALILSAIGLFTRSSTIVAAVLGFYLLGLPHNFGHTYHFDALLVLALLVMAFSRAGDAWSVDALIARREVSPSAEYTWPIRMIWTAMALVFFAAGLAKLRNGGLEWIFSANMEMVLRRSAYHTSDADPITTLGLWIASHAWLSRLTAAFAVVAELGFITALVSRRARMFFVPAAAVLLIGIRVTMGPTFGGFLIANVFWVPWGALAEHLRVRVRAAERTRQARTRASDSGAPAELPHVATLKVLPLPGPPPAPLRASDLEFVGAPEARQMATRVLPDGQRRG